MIILIDFIKQQSVLAGKNGGPELGLGMKHHFFLTFCFFFVKKKESVSAYIADNSLDIEWFQNLLKVKVFEFLIFIISVLSLLNVQAQSAAEDFKKMNEAMLFRENLKMELTYKAVEIVKEQESVVESNKGYHYKQGDQFHTKISNTETIVSNGNTLIVDHENKMMLLMNTLPTTNTSMGVDPEQVLAMTSDIKYADTKKDKTYQLFFNDPAFALSDLTITINKVNNLPKYLKMSSIDADGATTSSVEITYKVLSENGTNQVNAFNLNTFLRKEKDTWLKTEEYKNYELQIQTTL